MLWQAARGLRCRRSGFARRCRNRTTSMRWRSTTWKTAPAARRRRSMPFRRRRMRSAVRATRWCCRTSHVKAADAMDYVFGYTCFIDGSARGLPAAGFFAMKSRDTFAPIGPWVVTKDEIPDPQKLQIRLSNNGTLMQNFNTSDMAHKIPRCVEWLSSVHALEPGDIVATGTNHRGLNPFMDGDKIELDIEGVGRLAFNVKDELRRKWGRETRLQMHERAAQKTPGAYPDITPQLTGKYAPAAR